MSTYNSHIKLYEKFRHDAENKENYEGTRVETYFLSAFHLIEACAAKERVHINKHQNVRKTLEENKSIFEKHTEEVWKNFQLIENQKRPKFAYTMAWTKEDMDDVINAYENILKVCLRKLEK